MTQLTVGGSSSSSLDLSKLIERSERLLATVEIQSQKNTSMSAGSCADRSWEQLARDAEKKLNHDIPQFQTALAQSDFAPQSSMGFNGRSKLNALLSDVRYRYQDRELTGLVLGQDGVETNKSGNGASSEPAFINNLHSTILVSVQEQQKKGMQKAHWRINH